jgi:predicted DCC family thiol-disulfide oxidoreductase YuxK
VGASPTVVYDGECGFCRCTVEWARKRLDGGVHFVAWQATDVTALGLTVDACREAVQWVDDARILAGHRAVAMLLRRMRMPWKPIGVLIDLPVVRLASRAGYWVVKSNRSRLVHFCRKPVE